MLYKIQKLINWIAKAKWDVVEDLIKNIKVAEPDDEEYEADEYENGQ